MLLPINSSKEELIVSTVSSHDFTIVSAETGSGKSTQIPQFLAKHFNQVIVTEPRIMAAKTLAKRVAYEMGVTLGEEVGYKTAYDKCASQNSKILYCTDGLQLIRTIFDEDLSANNVLVIDELHEWNLNIETLIAWCKSMRGKWNTKVVLMSATIDTTEIEKYFEGSVAVLNITEKLYDVQVYEREEDELLPTIKENILDGKNILVFVAGKNEIADVIDSLKGTRATVLPLHGEMDWDEQKKCFEIYSTPKVIVATNVAQTSITIPDIDVVVDTGVAKISIAKNGIQGLYLVDISQADIMQRLGRAGRTKDGKYFLCSNTPISARPKYTVPEIQRSILDRVVLQLAAVSLDAENLEFFHQPSTSAIVMAKAELTTLGALCDKKITNLGRKMVKIPVSVQLARMIVEAEKYGVTEQVVTIAAIIEMGGLLSKDTNYYKFTRENKSDLLAELDVWNIISQKNIIDFIGLGIRKKNFLKIREHIKKLKEALYGIVEMTHNDDREAILKSCLCGLVSHIFVNSGDDYCGIDGTIAKLNKGSCILNRPTAIVGIPKKIEYRSWYATNGTMNLVFFASEIDVETAISLAPSSVTYEESLRYSVREDAVEITTKEKFAGVVINTTVSYDKSHPKYEELKEEANEKLASNNYTERQEYIILAGKQFKVYYDTFFHRDPPTVFLDDKTLFTTDIKEFILDTGEKVTFSNNTLDGRKETNIVALRNAVEMYRLRKLRERKMHEYRELKIDTIGDAVSNAQRLGTIELTKDNGGYGDNPILVYGYLSINKNKVTLEIGDDEKVADESTADALQYLFFKEVEKSYPERKFSHQTGKKKVALTKEELEVKEDFYSLVREVMLSITTKNIAESLNFIEEYYLELVG